MCPRGIYSDTENLNNDVNVILLIKRKEQETGEIYPESSNPSQKTRQGLLSEITFSRDAQEDEELTTSVGRRGKVFW